MAKIKIDTDQILGFVQKLSANAPDLLSMAAAQGISVPGFIPAYLPFIGVAAQFAEKLGLGGPISHSGLPDTGPLGRGRTSYLMRKDQYSDKDVISVLDTILDPKLDLPKRGEINGTIEFVAGVMFPKQTGFLDAQRRAALDQILIRDGMSPKVCDRLGDMIFYGLTHFGSGK